MKKEVVLRFWAKVHKADGDGCWEWTAARNRNRYGMFWNGSTMVLAHRFSLELAQGGILPGKDACHRCDNPPCVRPDHLFLDTHKANVRDMVQKGRQRTPRGLSNPNAKLTYAQVLDLRRRHETGENTATLARAFGLSWKSAERIATGKTRRSA